MVCDVTYKKRRVGGSHESEERATALAPSQPRQSLYYMLAPSGWGVAEGSGSEPWRVREAAAL
jgi:hypothetical protein